MSTPTPPAPQPRPEIATIPAYVPGRIPEARPGMTVHKLSSNENPYPPHPAVLAAVKDAAERLNRYPDMGYKGLSRGLSEHLGVDEDRIAAATGSVGLVFHLLNAFCAPGDEVVYAWRSFEAYPIATAAAGARSVEVPLTVDGRHDLAAMAGAVTDRTRALLVCTPNNPTGPAVRQTELAQLLDRVPPHVLVVVDEAYREFVRVDDPVDARALLERPNVAVLRTFAKAYGLAGLRLGYLLSTPEIAGAVRKVCVPFGVTSLAQAAALAALSVEDELLERVDAIVAERERVVAALADQGWQLPEAQGNFVWFPLGERTGEFVASAESAGIVVRPFDGEGVRVTIADPEANDVLLEVAAAFR